MKKLLLTIAGCTGVFLLLYLPGYLPYSYAGILEKRWMSTKPLNQTEMEALLRLCSSRQIAPTQSLWGSSYKLEAGERMIQYNILYHPSCPLDVVYDQNGSMKQLFTSYE